ncbi:carbohydrate ABC transporter permease [Burkholderia sp. LMG 21824]|uniref:carbohydrate ABC transporter permease n=1 Tax=Burkholderia sp. LMG 21824 TaxID=3158172 RepID=UPI003C2F4476
MATGKSNTPWLEKWLPQLVLSPALVISLLFFYGLTIWVAVISFTESNAVQVFDWVGLDQYRKLWEDDTWRQSIINLARYAPVAVVGPMVLGCFLAILLDQKIRFEGGFRTLYLYPIALSFVVAGTVWRWLLAPDVGIEAWLHGMGFENASFDWIVRSDRSIYALAIVAVWQSTGFVMALFIAGLRGVDDAIFKAAMLDGASLPRIYWRIVLPMLRPTVFSVLLILLPAVMKTFDMVVVLTRGGPGQSSTLPAFYMFNHFFVREEMGLGSASGMIILMMCSVVAVPYIVTELRRQRHES